VPVGTRRLFLGTLAALAAVLAAAPAALARTDTAPSFEALARQFDYDPTLPLDVQTGAAPVDDGTVTVTQISYSIDGTHRMTGDLAVPDAGGPFAGIVFAPYRGGSHGRFEQEAVDLAARGAVAVSVDDLAGMYPTFRISDRWLTIRRVIALRRAIDLLLARGDVDPARIGYAGISDGAELGGILAGVDHRVAAADLMSGGGIWDIGGIPAYRRRMALLDPIRYIGHAAPTALLFQEGHSDALVPAADARAFQKAGSTPKLVRWYAAPHQLDAEATADSERWLSVKLGLNAVR
jgi:dienelactone hydrolase